MRDLKKEELTDLLYMYEQTFIDLEWKFVGSKFSGLCNMALNLNFFKYIEFPKQKQIQEIIEDNFKKSSDLVLFRPKNRKKAFYEIKQMLLGEDNGHN